MTSSSRVGSRFGPYILRRLLGTGGFGEVYEAEDTAMNRVVALKLLSSSYSHNPAFRERLFREARTAGRLHDPHVVPIHGCGEIDGQLYIDMRLIDGTDLQSTLDHEGALSPARAVTIVRQIAAALDAAHAETVIHRDVKPANILLGNDDFACLVDFGLANAATDTKLTSEGTTIGSFAYLAPERLASGEVTPGADIYALACVLFECLTGSAPYEGRTEIPALVAAHLTSPPPRPTQHHPGIPVGFDEVIARGMAKEPGHRYRTAGELAAAAQRALSTPVPQGGWAAQEAVTTRPWSPPPPPVSPPARPPIPAPNPLRPKSRRGIVLAVAAVALVAVTAAVIAVVAAPGPTPPPSPSTNASPPPTSAAPVTSAAPPLNAIRMPVIGFGELGGVAMGPGGDIYVVDTSTARVYRLPANSAAPVEVPFRGLNRPKRVSVDGAGGIYVTDFPKGDNVGKVLKLAPGAADPVELPFGRLFPNGVAADAAGTVFVAANDRVLRLEPGSTTPSVLPFGSGMFEGVTVDGAGNVYALQSGRVLKLAPGETNPTQLPFGQLGRAQHAAVDGQGTIYLVDNADSRGRLLKLPAGATTSTLLFAPENQPFGGVAIDGAGNIYLTENSRLLKVGGG
ncbi:serine/threonine-protein kinase [Mycobacterium asiaticum]|uniref:non-specific serine/threonine protein kinase n=1 Tax=Mycobacterium asiaticum TaxID=1790 RepID=A0A1A3CTX2_MYCAS|nr:serine/threonine-protein kinase [Mycobacterium asiaticum]OBI89812.1 hypothetical protein A9X01_13280 [Mycobacterium asiaticum]OBJ90605.1 hypothetical protein A5640_23270 [Mycobacterium asiaticum]